MSEAGKYNDPYMVSPLCETELCFVLMLIQHIIKKDQANFKDRVVTENTSIQDLIIRPKNPLYIALTKN